MNTRNQREYSLAENGTNNSKTEYGKHRYPEQRQRNANTISEEEGITAINIITMEEKIIKEEIMLPDGGWGWLVTVGGFINAALSHMIGTCFAIIFSRFLMDLETSSTTVAWIYNMQSSIFNIVGLVVGPLAQEFGWRRITFIGAVFSSLSLITSAFAPSAEFLYVTFGILAGIGSGATVCISMLIVPRYFDKKRGRANSILMAGFSIGQMIGPPFTRYLQSEYGFTGGTLLVGALLLHGCIASCLFHPVEWHMRKVQIYLDPENINEAHIHETRGQNKRQQSVDGGARCEKESLVKSDENNPQNTHSTAVSSSFDESEMGIKYSEASWGQRELKRVRSPTIQHKISTLRDILTKVMRTTINHLRILKSPRAVIIALGNTLFINGYINFIMMVPFAMQAAGHSLDSSAWCISVSAIFNLISRIVVNSLTDCSWFDVKVVYRAGLAVVAVCNFVFPLVKDLHWVMVTMGAWGCGVGATMGVYSLIMIDVMGLGNMTATFGATCLLIATGYITLGPFMGYIRDISSSYTVSMWISASLVSISFILWLFMPVAVAYDKREEDEKLKRTIDK